MQKKNIYPCVQDQQLADEGAGLVQQQPELAAQEFLQSLQTGQTEPLRQPAGAPLFRNRALIKSRVLKCFQVRLI